MTHPTHPNYTFDHIPTVDELRATVIKAQNDMLSVQWYTPQDFDYYKTGAASGLHYVFKADTPYAGCPYAEAQRSHFAMLEYIDGNGRLDIEKVMREGGQETLGASVNEVIGNTCTGSTGWAYWSCCNSISGTLSACFCNKTHGYLKVGDYEYDETIRSFRQETTEAIVKKNGREVMYKAYAKAVPGDLLVTEWDEEGHDHSTMVIENHVECREDGSIDPVASYIVIQDQHVGFNLGKTADGEDLRYVGHANDAALRRTYEGWFNVFYIPVTTAELIGEKPYTFPTCEMKNKATSPEDLRGNHIVSNYPQALVKMVAVTDSGEKLLHVVYYSREDIGHLVAFDTDTTPFSDVLQKAELPSGTKVKITATLSTGEVDLMAEFSV